MREALGEKGKRPPRGEVGKKNLPAAQSGKSFSPGIQELISLTAWNLIYYSTRDDVNYTDLFRLRQKLGHYQKL
jgi:hypothetical protein